MKIETDGDHVTVSFEYTNGVIVSATAQSLSDAIERVIARFKDMQDRAVEELQKWHLVRMSPIEAAAKGEPS